MTFRILKLEQSYLLQVHHLIHYIIDYAMFVKIQAFPTETATAFEGHSLLGPSFWSSSVSQRKLAYAPRT